MSKTSRSPVLNYTERIDIMLTDDKYAAYIECVERHGVWWVATLYVAPECRTKGYALILGRAAMQRWGHRELWTNARAFADQPLSDDQLLMIYRRFGFQSTDVPGVLRRPPSGAT